MHTFQFGLSLGWWSVLAIVTFLAAVFVYDITQTEDAILHNFPVIGHLRSILQALGPFFRQYWILSDTEDKPYSRIEMGYIKTSAERKNNKIGFGTERAYTAVGELHIKNKNIGIIPEAEMPDNYVHTPIIYGPRRRKPYICTSRINVTNMSRGALSAEAIEALSIGAKLLDCHKGTGEGGVTEADLQFGCKLIVQIGPAKFGFRTLDGKLDPEKVRALEFQENVVAIEIKLAQGAKPGLGGTLPKEKLTPEIATIRGVPLGQDCHSPNCWSEFRTAAELIDFVEYIAELAGKPVGIKVVPGDLEEIEELAALMAKTGKGPDYIVVDGGEGGTGAAPVTFADHVGLPISKSLPAVDNILRQYGIRERVVLTASGKLASAADIFIAFALGATTVNLGRGYLFSIGCIQARKCHTNECPTGICTQDKRLRKGLNPAKKSIRMYNFGAELNRELVMLMRAVGARNTWELHRGMVSMVVAPGILKPLSQMFPYPQGSERILSPLTPEKFDNLKEAKKRTEELELQLLAESDSDPIKAMSRLVEQAQLSTAHPNLFTDSYVETEK